MTTYSAKYICCYCGREFSRAWNKDRHIKFIHRIYHDKDFIPKILESNEFQILDPLSMEFTPYIRNTGNFRNSYQQEPTYYTTCTSRDYNRMQDYINWKSIYSNFQYEDELDSDDHKIELFRLVPLTRPKLWKLRRLFKNPNSPQAIMYCNYWWYRCISEKSSKPLDDALRRHMQRIWFH
jgi:hypothetical protein